ncbi:MAG: FecR domain-containing protein [Verrucomicrobia bacterium]|nr:FecR domain-containing protein [Verrucomicrobiota bacterium]MDA1068406.1 FecR domain-containing protein [Verrucomicrobiota bacterium]
MSKGNKDSEDSRRARIKQEASDWVIKQSFGLTAEEQDAFFEWLAADSEHAEFYATRQKTWKHLDILADWRPEHSLKPNPDLLDVATQSQNRWGKFIRLSFATAAVLTLGSVLWFSVLDDAFSTPKRLSLGEFARGYERHVLADGSTVELNLGSQASVKFDKSYRRVTLESGEAHFTIAKDVNRPFVVMANGVSVQAVGTIFNVRISEESVDVLVTEGRVRVDSRNFGEPVDELVPLEETIQELTAGQNTIINLKEEVPMTIVQTLSAAELETKLTWLKQVINFDAAPLSDIVFEFNRRNYRKIVIEDPSIEGTRLSVTIRPNNIDDFVELLELTSNIRAERIDNSVIILRSK